MHLYLLRHCEPESGTNPSLTEHGRAQAERLGDVLANVIPDGESIRILTSDLHRAAQTAKTIRTKLGVTENPTQFPGETSDSDKQQVDWLMTTLRSVASSPNPPKHIVVVWHYPRVGKAIDRLVGEGVLEWPDIYGAAAGVDCDNTFSSDSGNLRWFLWADMLL